MSRAYYNELDPYAAQWLRNLIAAGHIAPGDVDERDIRLVRPDDLRGYRQCHFFAGVGVWSYALRAAGWSDDEEVWSASCPCQPFSDAGKGEAFDDERDLWPDFFPLVSERRPRLVVGEQVASKDGLTWLDALHADLESAAYTVGAVDTCSAGVGSPNIRQRLYWVADAAGARADGNERSEGSAGRECRAEPSGRGEDVRLGKPGGAGLEGLSGHGDDRNQPGRDGADTAGPTAAAGEPRGLADAQDSDRRRGERGAQTGVGPHGERRRGSAGSGNAGDRPGTANGFWRAADWLCCTDGKWRPVESGTFPLVTGAPARLGRLRAYGNAINAEVAIAFLRACREGR